MFCSSCGAAVAQHLKYCNRCGSQLAPTAEAVVKKTEKRLDEYLDGLFWMTVFGLGLILGGIAVLQKLQLGSIFMIGYLVLSTSAFLVNFWLNLREILRITRRSREPTEALGPGELSPGQLGPMNAQAVLNAAPSITEHTTRELEAISKKHARL